MYIKSFCIYFIRYANIEDYSVRNNVYNRPVFNLFDPSLSWNDVLWLKRFVEFQKKETVILRLLIHRKLENLIDLRFLHVCV